MQTDSHPLFNKSKCLSQDPQKCWNDKNQSKIQQLTVIFGLEEPILKRNNDNGKLHDSDSDRANTFISWGIWQLMLGSILKIDHHFKGVPTNVGI